MYIVIVAVYTNTCDIILQRCVSVSAVCNAEFHDSVLDVVADVTDDAKLLVGGERDGGRERGRVGEQS